MEAKKKLGRPPLPPDEVRDARIMVRLTEEEYALLDRMRGSQSLSTWSRALLVAAARHLESTSC